MGIVEWTGARFLVGKFKDIRKGGGIEQAADATDKLLDDVAKGESENIQEEFVRCLLIPFARRLLRERPKAYAKMLKEELDGIRTKTESEKRPSYGTRTGDRVRRHLEKKHGSPRLRIRRRRV